MSVTATLARRLAVAALVMAGIAAVMVGMLVATAHGATHAQPAQQPAAGPAAPTVHEVTTELPGGAYTADEAFLADLLGLDTDLDPARAQQLIAVAHRYCDKVVTGVGAVPGAEVQTRDGYLASLTMAGDPHALTLDEATKLLDVAEAAYCPGTRA
jgi:hypothetical protein